jgi:hypothetical protein
MGKKELVTAPLDRGDILPGVTRDSIALGSHQLWRYHGRLGTLCNHDGDCESFPTRNIAGSLWGWNGGCRDFPFQQSVTRGTIKLLETLRNKYLTMLQAFNMVSWIHHLSDSQKSSDTAKLFEEGFIRFS